MTHLTDEQFEEIMQGEMAPPEHLQQCDTCRNSLAEKQAMAARLRRAFDSIQVPEDLEARIRHQLNNATKIPQTIPPIRRSWAFRISRRTWSSIAAVAAVVVIAIPLVIYFSSPSAVEAAQAELVKIHQHNLGPHQEFYSDDNPEKLAEYFKDQLGFTPAFPCTGKGLDIRGCCVTHFRGEIVGSYVVDTPKGVISVIVVTDTPESIGMTKIPKQSHTEHIFWSSSFARCNMVTVRIGNYSYCAVGEVSLTLLTDLLRGLIP